LGLRLADGLAAGTIPTTCKMEKTLLPTMAGLDVGGGENGVQRCFLWVVHLMCPFVDSAVALAMNFESNPLRAEPDLSPMEIVGITMLR